MDSTRELHKTEGFILSFTKYVSFLFIALFICSTIFSLLKIVYMRADVMAGTKIVVDYESLRKLDEKNVDDIAIGIQQLSEYKGVERKYDNDVYEIIQNAGLVPVPESYDFIMKSTARYPENFRDDYIGGMKKLLRTAISEKENKEKFGSLLDRYNRVFNAKYQNIESENLKKLMYEKYYLGSAAICFVSLLLFVVILILLRIEGNTRNTEINTRNTTYVIPRREPQTPPAGMDKQQNL